MSSPWPKGQRLIKRPSVSLAQHSPPPTGKNVTCSPQGNKKYSSSCNPPMLHSWVAAHWLFHTKVDDQQAQNTKDLAPILFQVFPVPTKGASTHAGALHCPTTTHSVPRSVSQFHLYWIYSPQSLQGHSQYLIKYCIYIHTDNFWKARNMLWGCCSAGWKETGCLPMEIY